ncbi:hypothetical protein PHET_04735 [Paragonimus heterotremus]|uniref:LicD/FKTN/FKRP nucleotidyltransferase domain-containing protein n=1 Tax=Paragonimus heterotremus TaxID=100268 RepID=A0A8J4SQC7_9TREM|nr:hypothetical protein PHET_04735 [Paragonimus heterotremus]
MKASHLHTTCLNIVSAILIIGIIVTHLYPTRLWFPDSADYFLPIMSQQDQEDFMHLLRVFQKVVETNNISYMLISGSAIGAMRHHGMIPWDDDIDIMLDGDKIDLTDQVLSQLAPTYELHKRVFPSLYNGLAGWKLCFANKSRTYWVNAFRWPYLDLFFYKQNVTHWIPQTTIAPILKSHVFPLRRAPFGLTTSKTPNMSQLLWLPIPCRVQYASAFDVCASRSFSHLLELPIFLGFQRNLRCEHLHRNFPFVYKNHTNTNESETRIEELRVGTTTHYRLHLEQPRCDGNLLHSSTPFQIRSSASHSYENTVPEYLVTGFKQPW